ncbi:MAG: hypothetical protein LBL66_09100 [Clostridiales bacterium]|nr:hypothetical protein [Clostridiales bacterium]
MYFSILYGSGFRLRAERGSAGYSAQFTVHSPQFRSGTFARGAFPCRVEIAASRFALLAMTCGAFALLAMTPYSFRCKSNGPVFQTVREIPAATRFVRFRAGLGRGRGV